MTQNDDDFGIQKIDYILNLINDQSAQMVKDNNTLVQRIVSGIGDVKNEAKLSNKAMDAKTNALIEHLKGQKVLTEKLTEYIKESNKTLQEFKKETGTAISSDTYATAMTELLGRAHQQSMYAVGHGGTPLLKYSENDDFKAEMRDLVEHSLDMTTEKLAAIFNSMDKQRQEEEAKGKLSFINTFIDELSRSKLFGGTFMDFIKLLTYSAASFMKKYGKLGAIIGVGIIGAIPALVSAIGATLNAILTAKFISLFLKMDQQTVAMKAGGGAGFFGFGGNKFMRALRSPAGLALAGGTAALGLAMYNKGQGENELDGSGAKKAHKTAEWLGYGATATLGVAGVAGLGAGAATAAGSTAIASTLTSIAAMLGPIGWTLLGIAAGITAIVSIVKNWNKIKDWWSSLFGNKKKEEPSLGVEPLRHIPTRATLEGLEGNGAYPKVSNYGGIDIPVTGPMVESSVFKRDKSGRVTNFGDVPLNEGWKEIKRLYNTDPYFRKYYEVVNKEDPRAKHINFSSFETNFRSPNKSEVVLARGILDNFINLKDTLGGAPGTEWTQEKLDSMKITSGIASRHPGSPHSKGGKYSHGAGFAADFASPSASLNRQFFADMQRLNWGQYYGQLYQPRDYHDIHAGGYKLQGQNFDIKVVEPALEDTSVKVEETKVKKSTTESLGEVSTMKEATEQLADPPKTIGERISAIPGIAGNGMTSRILQGVANISILGGTDALV